MKLGTPPARAFCVGAGTLALVGVVVVGVGVALNGYETGCETSAERRRNFSVGMADGLSARRHGYYGIDFVRCGKCRMEKRKPGPLTFGGFNVLVLEDLSVVLPGRSERMAFSASDKPQTAKELARAMGIDDGVLKSVGWKPRFSGLRISNLLVSTLDVATNVVSRFAAAYAEAESDGLRLQDCRIFFPAETNFVRSAVLMMNPTLHLEWQGGELPL